MRAYKLTLEAEDDLLRIWRYTARTWGKAQADLYFSKIEKCFKEIGGGKLRNKPPVAAYRRLRHVRCGHHYIFYLTTGKTPEIVAILHEKMDFLARLEKRLQD